MVKNTQVSVNLGRQGCQGCLRVARVADKVWVAKEGISNHALSISSCAVLISRSQPKIQRKIQKICGDIISRNSAFSHVCCCATNYIKDNTSKTEVAPRGATGGRTDGWDGSLRLGEVQSIFKVLVIEFVYIVLYILKTTFEVIEFVRISLTTCSIHCNVVLILVLRIF